MSEQESLDKAARLFKLTYLLFQNKRGLTVEQMAQATGVSTRQIYRDMETLQDVGVPLYDDPETGTFSILAGHFIPPVHFSLEEAVALYVAARLLARYSDDRNPLIVDALSKLASALPATIGEQVQQTVGGLLDKPEDRQRAAVFATVTRGWAERRKVRIWHQAAESEHVHEYLLSPYFIEPSAVGYATHVIGHSTYWNDIRTFKLERVRRAELTEDSFEIPEDFDPLKLLSTAWGIMFGDKIVEVRLRFSPEVTRRVKESRWHEREEVTLLSDGGCLYKIQVAHPLEMKWWIRSWGPNVEVLAPEKLRSEMAEEARRVVGMYEGRGR